MNSLWMLVAVNVAAVAFAIMFAIRYGRRQERQAHARSIHPAAQAPVPMDQRALWEISNQPCQFGDAVFSCPDFIGQHRHLWCLSCTALAEFRALTSEASPLRADSAPRSGAACPDPLDGDAGGSGHASNLP